MATPFSGPVAKRLRRWLDDPTMARRVLEACLLITLVAMTLGERTLIASQRHIMPAGDVFNFQSIARNIRHFDYPIKEKRLPGFAIALLVGTELGFDPTQTGIAISILSSAATTAVLYLLGRRLRFPPLPLALCLLLTSVAPLLTINGVRPLSDSFFLFLIVLSVYLATIVRPTKRSVITTGCVLMLLAFTRYEGIPMAFLLLALLWLRIPWRWVLLAAVPLLIAIVLWLPVAKKVHGSIREFGYFKDAQEIADLSTLPSEYLRVINSAGFGVAWDIRDYNSEDQALKASARELPSSPAWWLSVLATFGVFWLIVASRQAALPLLTAFAFYPVLPAWWFLYSRYVAPMTAFYFFAAAAGAAGVWVITQRLLRRGGWPVQAFSALMLTLFLVKIVLGVAPGFFKEAQARGWENNGNGYALYQALTYLKDREERVAVSADYLMASMMFGSVDYPPDGLNNGRGMYLSAKPQATAAELTEYMRQRQAQVLVDDGEPEMPALVRYLQEHDYISHTQTFTWPRQDGDTDTTYLHYLQWSPD
jgi:hypothetical protein